MISQVVAFAPFLAEFERMGLCRLSPGATDAREAVWLVLVQKDTRAAKRHPFVRQAASKGMNGTPPSGRVIVRAKLWIVFHEGRDSYSPSE